MGIKMQNEGVRTADVMRKIIPPMVNREELADVIGYVTNAGTPGSVVPHFIGEWLFDTSGNDFYVAFGTSAGEWQPIGANTLTLTELAFLDGALSTNLVAIKAAILGTGGALTLGGALTAVGSIIIGAADLNEADLEKLDSITDGTGAPSKAVVLDSNGDFKMADGDFFNLSADTLALAGTNASNAAALVDQITIVTGADGVKGAVLPAAADLLEYAVINDSPTYAAKVYPVSAGNDVINELASDEAFILAPGRSVTFKAISATQWYADRHAAEPVKETHFEVFDDFTDAAIDTTNNWIVFKGTTAADDLAAVVAGVPEGQILMGNGAANDAQDKTVLSLILLAKGSLISLGKTVFETRVSFGAITGCSWGFGLGDVLANATEVANYAISAVTVTDDAGIANAISFVFDTDATAVLWQACSTNAGTVGNGAVAESLVDVPAVNTYQTLRIEVDATGDARFYINGVMRLARPLAVATTALLIPYIWGDSGVAAQTAVDVHIDYIKFQGARPSSDA